MQIFTLGLVSNEHWHFENLLTLEEIILGNPQELCVKLVGSTPLLGETALLYVRLLERRSKSTRLTTLSYGSLCGAGELLVWLQGDDRIFPHDASVILPEFKDYEFEHLASGYGKTSTIVGWPSNNPYAATAPDVYRRLEDHLELKDFIGRQVRYAALWELGLVANSPIEKALRTPCPPEINAEMLSAPLNSRQINREIK